VERALRFQATRSSGEVSALLSMPEDAFAVYVLAHGAGAGMDHPFMEAISARLADRGVATLRYQFPYMEAGGRRPDPPPIAQKTVRSAVDRALEFGLPVFAGGRSFGDRMTAYAAVDALEEIFGLVFLGFPLHPSGRDGTERWGRLTELRRETLFLQGDRDRLANLDLLRPLVADLQPEGKLHIVEGGDHSFKVLKRSGRSEAEVLEELSQAISDWAKRLTIGDPTGGDDA
jgi:predicted alpha/beta-hydrolase family hydrolase